MIPTWLQPILEDLGRLDIDGVSRHCRTCGHVTIRGLDEDRAALAVTCDPHPLDGMGEVVALMTGRHTYRLVWRGRYELDHRDQHRITGNPPGPGCHVVAEHRCHAPLLPTIPTPTQPTPKEPARGDPPF